MLNAAARLTAGARKFDHVIPLLSNLHLVRVPERIQYKLCFLVQRCVNGAAPQYSGRASSSSVGHGYASSSAFDIHG